MKHIVFIVIAIVVLISALPAHADKRVALVIGNSDYTPAGLSTLSNPKNDANDLAEVLKQQGFTLIGGAAQLDLTRQAMLDRILEFGDQLGPQTVGLFYYAGHGIAVDKTNFLVPVDGKADSKRKVRSRMVSADVIIEQFTGTGGGLNIMILDACRNTPSVYRAVRSSGGNGLTEMPAASGILISYATQPGNLSIDGKGRNSPYAAALMDVMKIPGLGVLDAFNRVSLDVKKSTNGFQVPWNTSVALEGNFFFAGAQKKEPILKVDRTALELAFWKLAEESNKVEDYQVYLQQFPNGKFTALAKSKLRTKQSAKVIQIAKADTAKNNSPALVQKPIRKMRTITNSRVRSKPSKNSNHLFTVPQGAKVSVLATSESRGLKWHKIVRDGKRGYIFAGLLEDLDAIKKPNNEVFGKSGWVFLGNYNGDKWTSRYTSHRGSNIPQPGSIVTIVADTLTVRTEPTLIRLMQNDMKAIDYLRLGTKARIIETRKYPFTVYVWAKVEY
jgi:hypothetical protein